MKLLFEVGSIGITVASTEVDYLFTNVMSYGQEEDEVAIDAEKSCFVDWGKVNWIGEQGWRNENVWALIEGT